MELVGDILGTMIVLMGGLRLFPERMKKNLEMTHGMIVTEHLMLVLGEYIGKCGASKPSKIWRVADPDQTKF